MSVAAAMPDLSAISMQAPMVLRGVVLVLGLIVLVAGARVYKAGLLSASFIAGALSALWLLGMASTQLPALGAPMVLGVAAGICGLFVMAIAAAAHRIALIGVGAVAGLTLAAAVLGMLPLTVPVGWWWPLPAALIGAVAFPFVYRFLLKLITPAVGAMAIAWAVGRPDTLWLLGLLWVLGVLVQTMLGTGKQPRKKHASDPDAA